jgi:MoaA/NifB/PqqE/SkfB family radical SAM enzyme
MKCIQEIRRDMVSPPAFIIGMVLMKRNLAELPAMVHFAKDVGADLLHLSRLVPYKGMQSEVLDGSERSVIIRSQAIAKGLGLNMGVPGINGMAHSKERCFFLYEKTYIDSLGRIIPCCSPEHPVAGSLAERSFEEIWKGSTYQAMRQTFANGPSHDPCQKCASSGYLAGF